MPDRPEVLERTTVVDGHGEVRWTRRGDGPPVVLCHGTPWSSWLWEPLADALAATHQVHTWDMLGYGRSQQGSELDVSLDAQGRLLATLVERWQLDDPPHVVAHDYGGAVALRAHLRHDTPCSSLALVDVVALAPWGSSFFRLVHDHVEVFEQLPAAMHEALVRSYVAGAAHQPLAPRHLDALVAPWLGPTGQAAFYAQIAQADQRWTDEVEPRYPELDLPVLVVWGEQDTWIPVDRAHRLAELVPAARLVTVPDAGHLIQLDAPVALTATLVDWLRR